MAHPHQVFISALFLTLALASVDFSACYVLKGSVSCVDCNAHHLSGIMVSVKCSHEKKLGVAITEEDGSFETNLHSKQPPSAAGCTAKILGATQQLYVSRKISESKIIRAQGGHYTTSEPLRFYTNCPNKKCGPSDSGIGSSKTVDLPVPREWGLAPTSYYLPFIPIIGIP